MAAAVPLSPVEMKTAMTNNDAIRILQHAAFYIFSSRVVGGPGRRMRGTVDLWQAMATLDRCRRELLQMPITMRGAPSKEGFRKASFGSMKLRQNAVTAPTVCG